MIGSAGTSSSTQRHFIGIARLSRLLTISSFFKGHFLSPRAPRIPTRYWDRTALEFTQSATTQHGGRRKSSWRNFHSNTRTGLRSAIVQAAKAEAGADSRLDSRSERLHRLRCHKPAFRFFGRLERVDDDMEEIDSDNRRRRNQGILIAHRLTGVNARD